MKKGIFAALAVFCIVNLASANEIQLKPRTFTGWKYSQDGVNFYGIGYTGKTLMQTMDGNELAQKQIRMYGDYRIISAILGFPGRFMLGWVAGKAITGRYDESKNTDDIFLRAGISLTMVSLVFEAIGNYHLKKGVRLYNGEEQGLRFNIDLKHNYAINSNQLNLCFVYKF